MKTENWWFTRCLMRFTIYYDRDGNWSYSALNTGENAGDVQALLNRPLGKRPEFILVPNALDLIPEALESRDDLMCVPRQIAALTGQDEAKVADQFDDICPGWREEGISSNSILEYAKKFDHSAYCFSTTNVF